MYSKQWEDFSLSSETESDSDDVNLQLQSQRKSAEENGNQRPVVFIVYIVYVWESNNTILLQYERYNIVERRRCKTTLVGTLCFMAVDRQSSAGYNDHQKFTV